MGLTSNFYNHSTVGATALYAIQRANSKLAYQCFNELMCSGEDEYAYQIAILGWLLGPPSGSKSYAYLHSPRTTFMNAVCSNSVAYELPQLSTEKPVQNPALSDAKAAIQAALKRKDLIRAVYLSRPYYNDLGTLFAALNLSHEFVTLADELLFAPLVDRVVLQAYAYKLTPAPPSISDPPATKGRCFAVDPTACALWGAQCPPRPMNPAAIIDEPTAYWQAAIDKYKITKQQGLLKFPDDDNEEAFYVLYFPNDLPDEWSLAEQMKSHGLVAAEPAENVWRTAFVLL
jgi:hypothetical protein